MLDDGRRQIGAFYLSGDIFGVEASEPASSSAEAICDAQILVVKRSAVMARAEHDWPSSLDADHARAAAGAGTFAGG